jgi:large subunit ribosomal protein L15
MDLSQVHVGVHRRRRKKRVARGVGSGHGKTGSRGSKGQKSRSGAEKPHRLFEGGQMKIARRIPKRGFNNRWALTFSIVNVSDLDGAYQDGETVDVDSLRRLGLVRGRCDGVKILGDGELKKKLTVRADRFSESARTKIAAAGGSAELVVQKPAQSAS